MKKLLVNLLLLGTLSSSAFANCWEQEEINDGKGYSSTSYGYARVLDPSSTRSEVRAQEKAKRLAQQKAKSCALSLCEEKTGKYCEIYYSNGNAESSSFECEYYGNRDGKTCQSKGFAKARPERRGC